MARSTLTVVDSPAWGEGVADVGFEAVDAANGNDFANDGNTELIVNNASAGAVVVTINAPASPRTANKAITKTLSVAAGKTAHFGDFRPDVFNTSSGKVEVDFDTGTSITAAVVRRTRY